jgi:hypothetical protein
MGAFSPFERAYRLYMNDRKSGNRSAKAMVEGWVREAKRWIATGLIIGALSAYSLTLIADGEMSWWKIVLFIALVPPLFGSIATLVVGVGWLFEDSILLHEYRQIESGHEEKKNE